MQLPLRLILDTSTFIWAVEEPERISASARASIEDDRSKVYLSTVSPWEMAIKAGLGKLNMKRGVRGSIRKGLVDLGLELLPIALSHVLNVEELEDHHKDPFDRLIISQAQLEGLSIVTSDVHFEPYPIEVVW